MTTEALIATCVTIGTAVGAFGWWAAKRLMSIGSARFEQEIARDLTRTTILKLDTKVDTVVSGLHAQDKQLAILVYSAEGVNKRLNEHDVLLDEHGNRLTALETMETKK
jgi:hypothetical protein